MASDDLFFHLNGEETRPYVLVRLVGNNGVLGGEAAMAGPIPEGMTVEFERIAGELPPVLSQAQEFAMLKGFDLRIDLNGKEWPEKLGILAR